MRTPTKQLRSARPAIAACLLMVGSSVPFACFAQIYGWIDSTGVVTYSNLPPPRGVDVTEVIDEPPSPSPKAIAEENRRIEVDALKDRIRLLEIEQARSQHVAVDYPAMPMPPVGNDCGPQGMYDCNSDLNAYYYTPALLGGFYPYRYGRNYGFGHGGRRGPGGPAHGVARSGGGGHSGGGRAGR